MRLRSLAQGGLVFLLGTALALPAAAAPIPGIVQPICIGGCVGGEEIGFLKLDAVTLPTDEISQGLLGWFQVTRRKPGAVNGDVMTLAELEQSLGQHHLQWFQKVVRDTNPPDGLDGNPLKVPYIDPPDGGYGHQWADALPWFFDERRPTAAERGMRDWGPDLLLSTNTLVDRLLFHDGPGGFEGDQIDFATFLVSVRNPGAKIYDILGGFSWGVSIGTHEFVTVEFLRKDAAFTNEFAQEILNEFGWRLPAPPAGLLMVGGLAALALARQWRAARGRQGRRTETATPRPGSLLTVALLGLFGTGVATAHAGPMVEAYLNDPAKTEVGKNPKKVKVTVDGKERELTVSGDYDPSDKYKVGDADWEATLDPIHPQDIERGGTANFLRVVRALFPKADDWEFVKAGKDLTEGSLKIRAYDVIGTAREFMGTVSGRLGIEVDPIGFYVEYVPGEGDPRDDVHWIQVFRSNHNGSDPLLRNRIHAKDGKENENAVDITDAQRADKENPYYDSHLTADSRHFLDTPLRVDPNMSHFWIAELYLVTGPTDAGVVTVYNGIRWGWENHPVPAPAALWLVVLGVSAASFRQRASQAFQKYMRGAVRKSPRRSRRATSSVK